MKNLRLSEVSGSGRSARADLEPPEWIDFKQNAAFSYSKSVGLVLTSKSKSSELKSRETETEERFHGFQGFFSNPHSPSPLPHFLGAYWSVKS